MNLICGWKPAKHIFRAVYIIFCGCRVPEYEPGPSKCWVPLCTYPGVVVYSCRAIVIVIVFCDFVDVECNVGIYKLAEDLPSLKIISSKIVFLGK